MRNLSMAILAGGLLVSMDGAATAQNIASAGPAPKKEFVVFADKGSATRFPPLRRPPCVAQRPSQHCPRVILIGRAENIAP